MKQFLDIELDDNPSVWKQLCDIVRRVDPKAADWMEENTPVDKLEYLKRINYMVIDVNSTIFWAGTPQGAAYWSSLHVVLKERYPEIYPMRIKHW